MTIRHDQRQTFFPPAQYVVLVDLIVHLVEKRTFGSPSVFNSDMKVSFYTGQSNLQVLHTEQEGKMSAAGHGGLSPWALSRTHAGKPISRNGAKTLKSLRIVCQMKIGTKA